MNTLPTATIICTPGDGRFAPGSRLPTTDGLLRLYALVPLPDGLVLVREDCDTCKDGCECGPQGQCRGPYPCPDCLGAPLLAWYRECDRCDGKGVAATGKGWPVAYGTCPAGCVGVDGRRLVKVRRNP